MDPNANLANVVKPLVFIAGMHSSKSSSTTRAQKFSLRMDAIAGHRVARYVCQNRWRVT